MPARKAKPLTVEQQRKCLEALSQTAAALLVGLTTRGLQKAQPPAPRNGDGSYSGPQLVQWVISRSQSAEGDDMLDGGDSPELTRYRSARADLVEMERDERRGSLVNVDSLVEWWSSDVAAPIRRAIDALCKQFGPAAAALVTTALTKAEAAVAAKQPAKEPPCS